MIRKSFWLAVLFVLCAGCSTGVTPTPGESVNPLRAIPFQGSCGDAVCDGPENNQTCPQDCAAITGSRAPDAAEQFQPASFQKSAPQTGGFMIGVVEAEIQVDRTPGWGDCGVEPWYSPDCTQNMKMWWEMHLKAHASAPVLIVPDGQERWVITSQPEAASKYGVNLADYDYTSYNGEYTTASIKPDATTPECTASISAPAFDFQVMGTREEGLTVLTLSANPVEMISGSCGQAQFNYDTQALLDDWAYALTGAKGELSFQMNDTFYDGSGTYNYEVQLDANPSPEKRDHIQSRLTFMCMAEEAPGVRAPVACPWDK